MDHLLVVRGGFHADASLAPHPQDLPSVRRAQIGMLMPIRRTALDVWGGVYLQHRHRQSRSFQNLLTKVFSPMVNTHAHYRHPPILWESVPHVSLYSEDRI